MKEQELLPHPQESQTPSPGLSDGLWHSWVQLQKAWEVLEGWECGLLCHPKGFLPQTGHTRGLWVPVPAPAAALVKEPVQSQHRSQQVPVPAPLGSLSQ